MIITISVITFAALLALVFAIKSAPLGHENAEGFFVGPEPVTGEMPEAVAAYTTSHPFPPTAAKRPGRAIEIHSAGEIPIH